MNTKGKGFERPEFASLSKCADEGTLSPRSPRERPILFSGAMVRALLDGRKTQTRRVVKFSHGAAACFCEHPRWRSAVPDDWHCATCGAGVRGAAGKFRGLPCPYGVPGDRLWVKETWQAQEAFDAMSPTEIGKAFADEHGEPWCPTRYVADGRCEGSVDQWQESPVGKTRVSIHMPRWASRITLEITGVRVERLNEISIEDAIAEGLEWAPPTYGIGALDIWSQNPIDAYAKLWEHINGPGSWDANPFVWIVDFAPVAARASGLASPLGDSGREENLKINEAYPR